MTKYFLSCFLLLANTAMSDSIEYCKIKYAAMLMQSAYDVAPKGSRKNGHLAAREALISVGLSLPPMDKTINPILSSPNE